MSESLENLLAEIRDAPSLEAREQVTGISLENLRATVKALAAFNVLLGVGAASLVIIMAAGWLPVAPDAGSGSTVWQVLGVTAAASLVGVWAGCSAAPWWGEFPETCAATSGSSSAQALCPG